MKHKPERSFLCGVVALDKVAHAMNAQHDRGNLMATQGKVGGFSHNVSVFLSNFVAYFAIGYNIGLKYAFITFGLQAAAILLVVISSSNLDNMKADEQGISDFRIEAIEEIVKGARTIKCYVWEEHMISKVSSLRKKQLNHTW